MTETANPLLRITPHPAGIAFLSAILGQSKAETKSEPEPPALPDEAPEAIDDEVVRIGGELVRMHRDGAIDGADDPNVYLLAGALSIFNATYIPKDGGPCS